MGISVESFDRHVRPKIKCAYVGDLRVWKVKALDQFLDGKPDRR